ncbi:hypothetical protein GCM10023322_30810 [Rugosimonospora acidiphila]|uniref:Uncharacterized protein n=1 Tax=Rugosimonospora acidiphila TaxID=556531 RepID=A0ABP9RSU4_9ACTN
MKFVRLVSGRNPYQVALMAAAPVIGGVLLAAHAQPPSVNIAMPVPVRTAWLVLLILAGVLGLTGVFWPTNRLEVGLSIEAAGALVLGCSVSMYAVAVLARVGINGTTTAGFTVAVAGGSWWRLAQIWADLRTLDSVMRALNPPVPADLDEGDPHE